MRKTIEESLGDVKEGKHLEITLGTTPFFFSIGEGPSFTLSMNDEYGGFDVVRVDVDKSMIGYSVKEYVYAPKEKLRSIGFSLGRITAGRKAHNYILGLAQEISEEHGLKLIDNSYEDAAKIKKGLKKEAK